MASTKKPVCQSGPKWLAEVAAVSPQRIGLKEPNKRPLAPLTGQDYQAYRTFLHALELYSYCDSEGERHALLCMQHAVSAMQPQTRWIARATIPYLLDWDHQRTLWDEIMFATPGSGKYILDESGGQEDDGESEARKWHTR